MSSRRTNFFRNNDEDKDQIQLHELKTSSLKSNETVLLRRSSTLKRRGFSMREPLKSNKFSSSLLDEQEMKVVRIREPALSTIK